MRRRASGARVLPAHHPFRPSGAGDLLFIDQRLQLAGLEHLHHDVGTAEEFALHVELRHGRPIGIVLDAGADLRVLEDVDGLVLHGEMIEDRDGAAGKAALRKERRALHEQHDVVILYNFLDAVADVGHFIFLYSGTPVASLSACSSVPMRPPNAWYTL